MRENPAVVGEMVGRIYHPRRCETTAEGEDGGGDGKRGELGGGLRHGVDSGEGQRKRAATMRQIVGIHTHLWPY